VAFFLAGAFFALVFVGVTLDAVFFAGVLSVLRLVFLAAGLLDLEAMPVDDLAVFFAGALEGFVEALTTVLVVAGLTAPNLERTGFSPQISSKL
jgi:hypothetical protein